MCLCVEERFENFYTFYVKTGCEIQKAQSRVALEEYIAEGVCVSANLPSGLHNEGASMIHAYDRVSPDS